MLQIQCLSMPATHFTLNLMGVMALLLVGSLFFLMTMSGSERVNPAPAGSAGFATAKSVQCPNVHFNQIISGTAQLTTFTNPPYSTSNPLHAAELKICELTAQNSCSNQMTAAAAALGTPSNIASLNRQCASKCALAGANCMGKYNHAFIGTCASSASFTPPQAPINAICSASGTITYYCDCWSKLQVA